MVDISGKGHHYRRSHSLLESAAKLALGVDLSSESRHAEIVLGTNGGDTLLLETTTHKTTRRRNKTEAQINTSLDFVGKSSPVRGVQGTHSSLELSGSDPIGGLVAGGVGDGTFGALGQRRSLPKSLETQSKLGSNGLEVASDEDTSNATLEVGGVKHLEGCTEVVSGVLVLELRHILTTWGDGKLRLGNKLVRPSPVKSTRQRALVIKVTLAEDL